MEMIQHQMEKKENEMETLGPCKGVRMNKHILRGVQGIMETQLEKKLMVTYFKFLNSNPVAGAFGRRLRRGLGRRGRGLRGGGNLSLATANRIMAGIPQYTLILYR